MLNIEQDNEQRNVHVSLIIFAFNNLVSVALLLYVLKLLNVLNLMMRHKVESGH
jgi:hypothetical protein